MTPGYNCAQAVKKKYRHYLDAVVRNGRLFMLFAMESLGGMSPECNKIISSANFSISSGSFDDFHQHISNV